MRAWQRALSGAQSGCWALPAAVPGMSPTIHHAKEAYLSRLWVCVPLQGRGRRTCSSWWQTCLPAFGQGIMHHACRVRGVNVVGGGACLRMMRVLHVWPLSPQQGVAIRSLSIRPASTARQAQGSAMGGGVDGISARASGAPPSPRVRSMMQHAAANEFGVCSWLRCCQHPRRLGGETSTGEFNTVRHSLTGQPPPCSWLAGDTDLQL